MARIHSFSSRDIDDEMDFLDKSLPRQHSKSSFIVECVKKGIEQIKKQKSFDMTKFISTDFDDRTVIAPSIFIDVPEYKKRLKDTPNIDLKILAEQMTEKLDLINREVTKRFAQY